MFQVPVLPGEREIIFFGLDVKDVVTVYLETRDRFIKLPREVSVEVDIVGIVPPRSVVVTLTLPGGCRQRKWQFSFWQMKFSLGFNFLADETWRQHSHLGSKRAEGKPRSGSRGKRSS